MVETDISKIEPRETVWERQNYVIYSLVNLENGKRYIGRSKNPRERIKQHFVNLKGSNHPNPLLNADSGCQFGYEILEQNVPLADGKEKERYYIDFYKSYDEKYGYNGKDRCVATILNPPKEKTVFYEEISVNTDKIRRLRVQQGLSQGELGKRMGCRSRSAAYNYESEKRNVSIKVLNKLARALNCSPLSLIEVREVESTE